MRKEQCGDRVTRAIEAARQPRRAHPEAALWLGGDQIEAVLRRLLGVEGRHHHGAWSHFVQRVDSRKTLRQRSAFTASEMIKLELVGREDVGGWHRFGLDEFRNALMHVNAAANVADDRV